MIDFLTNLDSQIFLFFNGMHNDFFDTFMRAFSGKYIWIPTYAALLLTVCRMFTIKQALTIAVMVAVVITLADQTCASLIRPYVHRLRPSNLLNPLSEFTHIVAGHRGGPHGFPSCHAANTFALATFMSLIFRSQRFRNMIFGWAVITIYSRVYLGVHYPGDLLVGAIIGSIIGLACYTALRYIAFGGHRPSYNCSNESAIIVAVPAGPFSPILSLASINFRYTDLPGIMFVATTLYIAAIAL